MYQMLNGYRNRAVWIYKYNNIVTDNEERNITYCYPVNKANLVNNFSLYVYFFSLHASDDYVPIMRRNICIYAKLDICHSVWMSGMEGDSTLHTRQSSTQSDNNCICAALGICNSVWMTLWYAGSNHPPYHSSTQSDKYTKRRIDTVISPYCGHIVARNMKEKYKHTKKNCAPSWLYFRDYTRMHSQKKTQKLLTVNLILFFCLNEKFVTVHN
jgi:hypothetical protein